MATYSPHEPNELWNIFFISAKRTCGFASWVAQHFRVRNEAKKLLPPFMAQYLNLMLPNGFTKILKTQEVQSCKKPPMNSGKTSTIFDIFYFVSQNICQFRWDANFENIFTYSKPITLVTQIFVKMWLILWYKFLDWSCGVSQVSYVDVI